MPSPTRFFRADPNKMGRGRGIYYKRGLFKPKTPYKKFENSYFSKYDVNRDFLIRAKGWRVNKIGIRDDGKPTKIPHSGDGRKSR